MWKEILWIVAYALKNTFRKRSSLLLYLGLPVAGVLVSTLLYSSSGQAQLRVGVANQDGSAVIAADTIAYVSSLQHVQVTELTADELQRGLSSGKLDTGLLLQKGFSEQAEAGNPGQESSSSP